MEKCVTGLHHITALTSDAQKNCDFYAGILGLRLVKKTVNFDAPDVYHLYYGNEKGSPGTIMTFFPFPGIPQGRKGKGQLTTTSFSAPANSLDFWLKRLSQFHVKHAAPEQRFDDELFIDFEDHDGLGLELVFNHRDQRPGFTYGNIPPEYAIKGFYGMALSVEGYEKTAALLTAQMDHVLIAEKGNRFRYSASGNPGDLVDVLCSPEMVLGEAGAGTVHHVAFATPTEATQLQARARLLKVGLNVTPVIDRDYFHSIYFREPGGVLFEIATVQPGFAIDESPEHLGESLRLPS
ncbi:MAG: VOC family protein, partial [Chlamydiota bacterium]